ncbi:MAG: hypothetical protein IJ863_06195 [Spirochaetales bacterium]|nr:hypothetical protein [Spirochaetales bacterium]
MLRKQLRLRKQILENYIKGCSEWIGKAPKGSIRLSPSRGSTYYFFKKEKSSGKGIRLDRKKHRSLIEALICKDYYCKVLSEAKTELKKIEALLEYEDKETLGSIYENLHPERKKLIIPLETTVRERIKLFEEDMGIETEAESGKYYIPTDRGELVRSMAEYNIANSLHAKGIPYKYEFPYRAVDGHYLHPDFTVINKSTGEQFIWEHFGMMDNPNYVKNSFLYKINLYAEDGIFIGKGLIATFTGFKQELKQEIIDSMIKKYLL